MTCVLPNALWIGHTGTGRDFRALFDADIQALVHLALEDPPVSAPRELLYCRFPLLDGSGNDSKILRLAIQTVADLLGMNLRTLVFCSAGMSRGPTIATAALALHRKLPMEEALQIIAAVHPVDVSPGLWNDVVGIVSQMKSRA